MRLPTTCLVVLVGPSGSGKSYWAARQFRPEQIVSSDRLRAMVGVDEHDQRAGTDAFELLDLIVARRLSRRLLTVVDTLGLDGSRRAAYRDLARRHGVASHAVVFDTPADVCRARNRGRSRQLPAKVLSGQLAAWPRVVADVAGEGFDGVHAAPDEVELLPPDLLDGTGVSSHAGRPLRLGFGLQVSSFPRGDEGPPLAERLSEVAVARAPRHPRTTGGGSRLSADWLPRTVRRGGS